MMLNMDPPQHAKFRRLVQRGFTPRMVSLLEPKIRASAKMLVDRIAKQGECEFVTAIAAELPLLVIADLIGVPQEERHKIFDWSNQLIGFDDPEFQNSMEDARMAAAGIWGFANNLAQQRKGGDGEDLVSVLMRAEVDGSELSIMEFDAFFLLLSVAGNETTRNLISGGMLALMENPEQRQRLHGRPLAHPQFGVEEMLRWVTPVMYFRRTVTGDAELRGVKLRENDKVCRLLLLGQPRRRATSTTARPSTWAAPPTSTSRSASASTSAWARASPASRSASCSRSC
jgi:cholest-4-en-3-one 26-monooxygenase